MKTITETALKLKEKFNQNYKEWCEENPGKIMNGNIIKVDVMEKASYCNDMDELLAMRTYYDVALRSAIGPNGFGFSKDAMDELINELENGKL
jgi:hypothetical protein